MALRGNLQDFSLPDVFQLVALSRKSGVLRISRNDGATGSVWFREGDVFFAQSNWRAELLGERLVRAQRVTPKALARALDLRDNEPPDGRRVGQILVDEGYITREVLESFVSEQIQDTIFDLMRWEEGEFSFEATPEAGDEDIGLSVSMENVVMEGSRRLEEWARIRQKIPSMDLVFRMAAAPTEGTISISLKPMEWNLLLLVDGTRSLSDLATAGNRTDFEVARVAHGLFSAGLLELVEDAEVTPPGAESEADEAQHSSKQAQVVAIGRASRNDYEPPESSVGDASRQSRAVGFSNQPVHTGPQTEIVVPTRGSLTQSETVMAVTPESVAGRAAEPRTNEIPDLSELLLALDTEEPVADQSMGHSRRGASAVGIDFSGGLNDELSALTGADRPVRPSATMNKRVESAPEEGLRRDTRVDRDMLLKIIEGIQNL